MSRDKEKQRAYNSAYYQAHKDSRKTQTSAAAVAKYQKEKTQSVNIRLMKNTEQDIIEKLESVPNKAGYIKSLIRADIAKGK